MICSVSPIDDESDLVSSSAYVLFYSMDKKNVRPQSTPIVPKNEAVKTEVPVIIARKSIANDAVQKEAGANEPVASKFQQCFLNTNTIKLIHFQFFWGF